MRRTYIPKADGRKRPIGVPTLEDKIVQRSVVEVLNGVYEADFKGFSYGSRPDRSQHRALDAVAVAVQARKVSWVLELDIRGFYDHLDHGWLARFVEHRVGDRRMQRQIHKWLKAGVLEEGQWQEVEEGTPQGGSVSPLLANIYLHYVLDLWVEQWRKREASGEVVVVRYADDAVVGFQNRADARRFREAVEERLRRFNLELHEEKTRLLELGRFAVENRRRQGKGKPETFDFLGFTHYCGRTRRGGFTVWAGVEDAERSELALDGTVGLWHPGASAASRGAVHRRESCGRARRYNPRLVAARQGEELTDAPRFAQAGLA